MSEIKDKLMGDIKACMKSGDKYRLSVLRLISSAVKQREVDQRVDTDDPAMLVILDKMVKQRRESIELYNKGDRKDLADTEAAELEIIQTYLPAQLTEAEIGEAIDAAIKESGAAGIRDMGKVMGILKPNLQGKADMSAVSSLVKSKIS